MGRGILRGAMQGLGEATERVGLEALRGAILAKRDERLNAYQNTRDDKMLAHQSGEAQKGREHQETLQGRGFEHAEGMQRTSLEHAAEQAALGREHSEKLQGNAFQHAEGMQGTALAHAASEGDKNRRVQSAGQGIQAKQVEILAKGAELDREIKKITVENAKEVQKLKQEFQTTTDPARKAQITETVQLLTGKDNDTYLPVPLKDDMGAIIGYQVFDKKRGTFVDKPGGGDSTANDPLGLRVKAPQADNAGAAAAPKSSAKPAASADGGDAPKAVIDTEFRADANTMSAKAFVAKYTPLLDAMSGMQSSKFYEIQQKASRPRILPMKSSAFRSADDEPQERR